MIRSAVVLVLVGLGPMLSLSAVEIRRCHVSQLRLRSSPSIAAPIVGVLTRGDSVEILRKTTGTVEIDGHIAPWYLVRPSSGPHGWVFGAYVRASAADLDAARVLKSTEAASFFVCRDYDCLQSGPIGEWLEDWRMESDLDNDGRTDRIYRLHAWRVFPSRGYGHGYLVLVGCLGNACNIWHVDGLETEFFDNKVNDFDERYDLAYGSFIKPDPTIDDLYGDPKKEVVFNASVQHQAGGEVNLLIFGSTSSGTNYGLIGQVCIGYNWGGNTGETLGRSSWRDMNGDGNKELFLLQHFDDDDAQPPHHGTCENIFGWENNSFVLISSHSVTNPKK